MNNGPTSRTRSMVLDNTTSLEAGLSASARKIAAVEATIVAVLAADGPLVDDDIVERYLARAGAHPHVPVVTPQRIRSARSKLVRQGVVRDTQSFGWSHLGHRATVWGLT